MSYEKQTFVDWELDDSGNVVTEGTTIGAAHLQHIEDGIVHHDGRLDKLETVIEPEYNDIPKVFFGRALAQTKTDVVMSFRYISKTKDISGWCKSKAQGSSSMEYPKKNQTVKLYVDEACTEKMTVDFRGWGSQHKFCFKANWIDLTHARNIVSARLWGNVVKSRASYDTIPELLRTSPNHGAVNGFPVKVYADGIYQGRYTLNIPKDAWMTNMDDDLDEHCILCGESESAMFTGQAAIDGTDWTDEIHDTVPDTIKARWNEAISFVMDSTDDEFVSGIEDYFDVDSLIDYYLFGLLACHFDGFHKNQLFLTYDGQKWYASMYDMDSTWGLWWDGSYFVDYNYNIGMADQNKLYVRLQELFAEDIMKRWEKLKTGVLSKENIINEFERFTDVCPPWLCQEDYAETTADGDFVDIPLTDANNIQQIRDFIVNRMAWVNRKMSGDENLIYSLQDTVFDGTHAVETGVCLFDEPQEATIFIDFTAPVQTDSAALLWTASDTEDDPPSCGVAIKSSGTEWNTVYVNGAERQAATSWKWMWEQTRGIVITLTAEGLLGICKFKYADGTTEAFSFPDATFVKTNGEIVLGAKVLNNDFADYFVGTVHNFKIWDKVFSEDEVDTLLTSVSV